MYIGDYFYNVHHTFSCLESDDSLALTVEQQKYTNILITLTKNLIFTGSTSFITIYS